MFAANAGTILGAQRASLDTFLRRGGGLVVHARRAGRRRRNRTGSRPSPAGRGRTGVAKYFEGENTIYYVNTEHPITKGASNFTITDEVYWDLHMMPHAHVLAASMQPVRPGRGNEPPPAPADRQADPADLGLPESARRRAAVPRLRLTPRSPLQHVLLAARARRPAPGHRLGRQPQPGFARDAGGAGGAALGRVREWPAISRARRGAAAGDRRPLPRRRGRRGDSGRRRPGPRR